MRTFIENYLHFMKNCIRPHYEKLKSLKSGFIENSIFENNRDPCRKPLGNTPSKAVMMVSTCFQGLLAHSAPTRCAHNPQASRHLQSGEGTGWSGHGSQDCNQRLLQMMLSQSMCHTPVLDQGEFGIFESQKERISFPTSEPHTGHTLRFGRLIASSRGGIDSFKTRPLT